MKVLIYAHAFAPSTGGVETYAMLLAEGLSHLSSEKDREFEVTVATRTPAGEMNDGLMPYRIVRRPSHLVLAKLVRNADVIHAAGPAFPPLVLGGIFLKPVIVEHSGYQSICPNGLLLYGPKRALCPGHFMARRYAECVRCNTDQQGWATSLRSMLLTFPRRWLCRRVACNVGPTRHMAKRSALPSTEVIFHGVPAGETASTYEKDRSEPICFAYVGRLVVEKGIPVLLRAASQLAERGFDFRVRILGDGPERQNLENISQQLRLSSRVEFLGSVPAKQVSDALGRIDAVVVPSVCEEVAGLTAIEQMMRGRLVIASAIGGLGEVVADSGLTFPTGDAGALADCMKRVLEKPETIAEFGKAAKARALELFNQDRMVEGHVSIYRKVLYGKVPQS
ncbi:MAG TPA: glycosyltransferase family 4 protein [Candidatus Acidoferrales bacterium]|nr:glycosyltransferase family 4 protein [Candidatus Acidoferrales bacterium]